MDLTVGGAINAYARNEDIAGALLAGRHEMGWAIRLDASEGDFIEATAQVDGLYALYFADGGRRFKAVEPVDSGTLAAIFTGYLNNDTGWRHQVSFVEETPGGARSRAAGPDRAAPLRRPSSLNADALSGQALSSGKRMATGKRIGSESPPSAIILVAAACFGLALYYFIPASWRALLPFQESAFFVVWIVAGPMTIILLAMIAVKLLQVRRASHWAQAAGRIVKSEVTATLHTAFDGPTRLTNVPAVAYEFSVAGRQYTGQRIGPGDTTSGANIEATLARYPVGRDAMVYYDPANPENCVLERNLRGKGSSSLGRGCMVDTAKLAVLGAGGYWLYAHAGNFVASHVREGRGPIVAIAAIFGILCLMAFFGSAIISGRKKAPWVAVGGKVMESGTESFSVRVVRTTRLSYAPVVEYAYLVNGREFRSRQIGLDDQHESSLTDAKKIAARYPKGADVAVFYDPTNPGDAAFERPEPYKRNWVTLPLAFASFAVAIYFSGFFSRP